MAAPVASDELVLGTRRDAPGAGVTLPAAALLRHVMALGSSGSGKTVFCKVVVEEAVRQGIPVICVDPQGDLCSLALAPRELQVAVEHGANPAAIAAFHERADVVVFTPASRKGVALCADPVHAAAGTLEGADPTEQLHVRTRVAGMVVSLLGYDLDSDEGAGLTAVVDTALANLAGAGRPAGDLDALTSYLTNLGEDELARYERFLHRRKIATACQRLARLDVGARRLLFHQGAPVNIELLLGRDATALPGKSRVSVIYLNTLHSQEDKDFFVAAVVEALYTWMLRNPCETPQALFYIDEVAPFIPPVRKPACKEGLRLLFKQARKYGVGCLMATQNPGDVDYTAMAQFGTWALGRLTTRQDLKKVEPTVKSLVPVECDRVMEALPAQRPGELMLLAPDHIDGVCPLQTRWLWSQHETLDEEAIRALADERWRRRFGAADTEPEPEPEPHANPTPTPTPEPEHEPEPEPEPEPTPTHTHARVLARKQSMSTQEFATRAKLSVGKARAALRALVNAGLAGRYRDGRQVRYWAYSTRGRPDLRMPRTIDAIEPQLSEARAVELAFTKTRSKFLGLIGEDEAFRGATIVHRLVYRLGFEEKVRRSLLARIFGPDHELRLGNVYLHPRTLAVLAYTSDDGIRFEAKPAAYASHIADFDDVVRIVAVAPGELVIDDEEWKRRRDPADVRAHFKTQFDARPKDVAPLFVPLWRLELGREGGAARRVVTIDAIAGKEVEWPR